MTAEPRVAVPTGGARKVRWELLHMYWEVLEGNRRAAVRLVAAQATAGVLEGLGLLAIVPMIQASVTSAPTEGLLGRILRSTSLSATQLAWVSLVAFALFGGLSAACRYSADLSAVRLINQIEERFRVRLSGLLMTMDWSSYLGVKMGEISSSMLFDVSRISTGTAGMLRGIGAVVTAAIFVIFALAISVPLTALTLLFGALAGLGYRAVTRRAERRSGLMREAAAAVSNSMTDIFGNLKYFRSTGVAPASRSVIEKLCAEVNETGIAAASGGVQLRLVFDVGGLVLVATILTISLAVSHQLTPASLVFLAVFYRLAPRLLAAQDYFHLARLGRPWYHRLRDEIDFAGAHQENDDGLTEPRIETSISVRSVSYTFPTGDRPALRDASFEVAKGECIAIVGPSGAGKTTLVDLITGLLSPTEGEVLIDGVSLTEIRKESWQRHIGLVMQETPLFHASVLENIAWGGEEVDRDRALRCAKRAHALQMIEDLPEGIDTVIGERGGRLSGGQRQRLALARALYRDPWLLILDEATSALDSVSEAAIQESLAELRGTCSIILVAHRLKTVEMADRILVLEDGLICQQGSWEDLVGDPTGLFAELVGRQGLRAM